MAVDAEKRLTWAKQTTNKNRIYVFMLIKSIDVVEEGTPDVHGIKLASHMLSGKMDIEKVTLVLANESALGGYIDDDITVTDNHINIAVTNKFNTIASAFDTAGLFG